MKRPILNRNDTTLAEWLDLMDKYADVLEKELEYIWTAYGNIEKVIYKDMTGPMALEFAKDMRSKRAE